MKAYIFFFIFTFCTVPSYAASLKELQHYAIKNRYIIAQYQANLDRSSSNITIAQSGFLPNVDLSYTVNSLDEESLFEAKENNVAYGAITWNLFSGFYDYYNIGSAKLLQNAQFFRLQAIKQDVQLNVALRYLDIYRKQSSLQVAQESEITLKKLFEDGRNRHAVGLIERNEVLRFKVKLDNATIIAKKAQAEVLKSLQRLSFETGQNIQFSELNFTEFEQLPILTEQQTYHHKMLKNRSEIKTLDETNKAVALQIKATYASHYPRLDVTGSYRKYENDYLLGEGNDYDEELRTTAVLSLNLFDGFSKQAKISKAKSEKRNIAAQLEELKQGLETDLTNLFFDYEVNLENITVSQLNIKQAEENLRITRLKYKEGLEQESDLLDAISNLSLTRYSHVFARTEAFANYYRIIRTVEEF